MNEAGNAGEVQLVEADMLVQGSYDEAFAGCCAVFHVAADIGTDSSYGAVDPQRMYRGLFDATENVLDSIVKAGTVQRLVYTSSCAAVMGPAPDGHQFTEADWAGAGPYETLSEKWTGKDGKSAWTIEANAYAVGKVECEKMTYAWGDEHEVEVITSCPNHVIGPLLAPAHDTIWQHRLGEVFCGKYSIDQLWNICDVRDVAESQRLMAESPNAGNGSRYINGQ
jgi:nucleoside-diphosphate-sugar epimerase